MTGACIAIDPTCDRCASSGRRWQRCDGNCDDLCRMFAHLRETPEGHEAVHAAERCRECGHPMYDDAGERTEERRLCRYGHCTEWHCASCDALLCSAGPIGCKCSSTWHTRMMLRWWTIRDRLMRRAAR